MSLDLILSIAVSGAAGLMGGIAYFALVRRSVELFLAPEGLWRGVALAGGRIGLAGLLFWAIAVKGGALPLVAALAGFLLARERMVR